jgi:hypothetical protein
MAYTTLSKKWPPSRGHGSPYQITYSLEQGSKLPRPWNSLPINKEERDRNGLKREADV